MGVTTAAAGRGWWSSALAVGVVLGLSLVACSGSTKPPRSDSVPPPACSSSPCQSPGAVRWSIPLHGVQATLRDGSNSVIWTTGDSGRFAAGAVGSTLVLGWDRSVRAFDVASGTPRWSESAAVVPSGQQVVAIDPVGPFIAVMSLPASSRTVPLNGTQAILDPATGHVLARTPVRAWSGGISAEQTGAIWSDGTSLVAIEPTAVIRLAVRSGKVQWSVPLPASSEPTLGAVGGSQVVYSPGSGALRAMSLADGKPAALPHGLSTQQPSATVGQVIILDSPATLYASHESRVLWRGGPYSGVRSVDPLGGKLYVVGDVAQIQGPHPIQEIALNGGADRTLPGSIDADNGLYLLDLVQRGVAVLLSSGLADGSVPSNVNYSARDATTGKLLWTSSNLPNYMELDGGFKSGDLVAATDFVAGLTCPTTTGSTAPYGCADPHLTVLNI